MQRGKYDHLRRQGAGTNNSRSTPSEGVCLTDTPVEAGVDSGYTSNAVDEYPLKHGANRAFVDKSPREKRKLHSVEFTPFPTHTLPSVLGTFVREVAKSIGCDESSVVMPVLAVCSAAIGTSRVLRVKSSWFVHPLLWTVVVGESGSQKSPPHRVAIAPLKKRQAKAEETYQKALSHYRDELSEYKRLKKAWDRKGEGDKPVEPQPPSRDRCVVQDVTIEALAEVLSQNPRGVLLARDELSGWMSSFDKYSNGSSSSSSDASRWLEVYGCEGISIDRKTGDRKFIHVTKPFVSIAGGIQPGILARCLTDEMKENGLQSRLLMAYPPRMPKQWKDDEVSDEVLSEYEQTVNRLFELKSNTPFIGEPTPCVLRLSDDAKDAFRTFVNLHGEEQNAFSGHLASQWSKLEETPCRLSTIIHCIRQVTDGVADPFSVDGTSMVAAIELVEWFKTECLRINRILTEPEEQREARDLAVWIERRGGTITARDLCRARRDIESTEDADLLLIQLVSMGWGHWETIHRSRRFSLFSTELSTNTP